MTALSREIYVIRHGETQWSKSGQHTGLTDIPLTERGAHHAKLLGKRIHGISFDHVYSSPLKRAFDTCRLCGLGSQAKITDVLLEWNYGDYEGKKTVEIHKSDPNWNIFVNGGPNGESPKDVETRADSFLKELSQLKGNIVLFSSGHFSRAFAVRFLGLPISKGRHFTLSTASLSVLSYDHEKPALKLWNDICHYSH